MDADLARYIDKEISRKLNIVLYGAAKDATKSQSSIAEMFPGYPTIVDRPVAHPYGLVSRAPDGTTVVNTRLGEHFGNRIIIAHMDKNRPDLEPGECVLYNQFGRQLRLEQNAIRMGSKDADNPHVLGSELREIISSLLSSLASLTVVCASPGSPSSVPVNAASFTALKAQVDAGDFLSDTNFGE